MYTHYTAHTIRYTHVRTLHYTVIHTHAHIPLYMSHMTLHVHNCVCKVSADWFKITTQLSPLSYTPKLLLLQIPQSHCLLKVSELREEAGMAIGKLLQLTASSTISSVNLMTIIVCLTNIAKQRPIHFTTVVQAFELLHGEYHIEFTVMPYM